MKNYAVIGYILYFLVFVAGLLVSAYNNLTGELPRLGVGILIALALFFSVIRPMIRYYLKRLYGKHLDSLTSYLNELQENHP
jgi:hypothetical protein